MRILLNLGKKKTTEKQADQKTSPVSASASKGHSVKFHLRTTTAAVAVIDKTLMAKISTKHQESISAEIKIKLKIINSMLNASSLDPETMLDIKAKLSRIKELANAASGLEKLFGEFMQLFAKASPKISSVMQNLANSQHDIANFVGHSLADDAENIITAAYALAPSLRINVVLVESKGATQGQYNELCKLAKNAILQAFNILKTTATFNLESSVEYLCQVIERIAKHREMNPESMFIEEYIKLFDETLSAEIRKQLQSRQEKYEAEAKAEREGSQKEAIIKMTTSYEKVVTSFKKKFVEATENYSGALKQVNQISKKDRQEMDLVARGKVAKVIEFVQEIKHKLSKVAHYADLYSLSIDELEKKVEKLADLASCQIQIFHIKKFFYEELPEFINTLYGRVYQVNPTNHYITQQLKICIRTCKDILMDERIFGDEKSYQNGQEFEKFIASWKGLQEAILRDLHTVTAPKPLPLMIRPQIAAQININGLAKKYRVVPKDEKDRQSITDLKHVRVLFKRAVSEGHMNGHGSSENGTKPPLLKRSASEADVNPINFPELQIT